MKTLTLVATLLLAGVAFAEGQLEVRVNRIDMAVTAPDETEDTAGTKAQDYNSSRSNRRGAMDKGDDGNGAKTRIGGGGTTAEDNWETPATRTQPNHNTTRRSSSATAPRTRVQDHNSTRSNESRVSDSGGIKDGAEDSNKRCRANGVDDDCNAKEAPATDHNTTRSNR